MWLLRVKTKVKSSFQNFDVCLKNAKYRVMVIKRLVWDFYTKCLSSYLLLFKVNTGVKHFYRRQDGLQLPKVRRSGQDQFMKNMKKS